MLYKHVNVLRALIVRGLLGRFGRHHLGFIRTVSEPMMLCAGAMIIWSMIKWTEYRKSAETFILPSQYLQVPISGGSFMMDWMPVYAQKLLLTKPFVHHVQMLRAGLLGESFVTHDDPWYLLARSWARTVLAAGPLYDVRNRIQVS
jgi:ABC-type polysaccharide/polyol phosphate export permease